MRWGPHTYGHKFNRPPARHVNGERAREMIVVRRVGYLGLRRDCHERRVSSQVGFTSVRSSSLILRKQIRTVHVSGLEFPIQTNRLSSGANNDDINMLNSARFSPIDAPSRSTHATSKTQGNLTPPKRAVPSSTESRHQRGTITFSMLPPTSQLFGVP